MPRASDRDWSSGVGRSSLRTRSGGRTQYAYGLTPPLYSSIDIPPDDPPPPPGDEGALDFSDAANSGIFVVMF